MLFSPVRSRAEQVPVPPAPLPRPVPAPQNRPAGRRRPLRAADRDVLWLYLCTRVGLWITAYCARWLFPADSTTHRPAAVLSSWQQWDWSYYLHIAQDGYFPDGSGPTTSGRDNRAAFFPGFPLVLRAVHTVVRDWTAAGLLISFTAGAVAVLALARIARLDLPGRGEGKEAGREDDRGRRAVLFFLLSPCAVFLAAGYTEALFLALALPAWLAARRYDWRLAGILTALATTVRVSGLFLAAAIGVHFLLSARAHRTWRASLWLALPTLPPLLYARYLHARTGDWMAWKHAEERGWYRDFHSPWESWQHTWQSAFGHTQSTGYAVEFQAELLSMVVGLALFGLLVVRRRWPEAVYIGLTLWALGTSYWYVSVPRAGLLWWPLWTLLAGWSVTRPRGATAYVCALAPLTTVLALSFLSGRWAG